MKFLILTIIILILVYCLLTTVFGVSFNFLRQFGSYRRDRESLEQREELLQQTATAVEARIREADRRIEEARALERK